MFHLMKEINKTLNPRDRENRFHFNKSSTYRGSTYRAATVSGFFFSSGLLFKYWGNMNFS